MRLFIHKSCWASGELHQYEVEDDMVTYEYITDKEIRNPTAIYTALPQILTQATEDFI
jgi:hypothetical protein